MTIVITTPVPQSKVPPNGRPGYATTIWMNAKMVGYLGGSTKEEALQNAQDWLKSYRGEYCNHREPGDSGGRICDMTPDHKGLHTDGAVSWGDNIRLAEQGEKLPEPTEVDE